MIKKKLIERNFSDYADYYDRYASIQNLCAAKLINKIEAENFCNILDIGCGTGNYTSLLKNKFPYARIKALDISQNMIKIAKEKLDCQQIEFIVADAEDLNTAERFDFISSNVSFQWFGNLEKTLIKYKMLLNGKGKILFSIFGPATFFELNSSLKEMCGDDVSITSCNFVRRDTISKMLTGIFNKNNVTEEMIKEKLNSLPELLRKIKYTGTRGEGIDCKGVWTPRTIGRLEEIYRKKFGEIIVTYQVFFCQTF